MLIVRICVFKFCMTRRWNNYTKNQKLNSYFYMKINISHFFYFKINSLISIIELTK